MMQYCRWNLLGHVMATGLTLAGCSDPADKVPSPEKPVDTSPASEQVDTRIQLDMAPEQREKGAPAPTAGAEITRKPLDLSMPPQPVIDPESIDKIDASSEPLLPDLFLQKQKTDDSQSTHFKGRVLMKEGDEQSIDSLEGGQLIIEKKTR